MKKIIAACVEQIIQFDSLDEANEFALDLINREQKFRVLESNEDLLDGKIQVKIQRQYNKNPFPQKEG